eukprot:Filipodium_phascolosomae@DN1236_c0_g1_i1.p1
MKVVVVGINHAGTSAIRTLLSQKKENDGLRVIAFDRNDNISFLGCGIALTVSGVVNDVESLFYSNPEKLEKMGAEIRMNHDVTKVEPEKKSLSVKNLKDGEEFEEKYDKLIYAGGSWPLSFPMENDHLGNIEICKLFQHAKRLIELADDPKVKHVAVIGAGYIGIELAEAYNDKGKQVTLLDICKRVVPRYFDTDFTDRMEQSIRDSGVTLALGEKVLGFEGSGEKVTTVKTDKGTYEADLVIKCIGFKPNTEFFPKADKVRNGALKVNEYLQTSIPDVYAIGDCAALYEASSQQHQNVALATNAVKSGVVAASHISGLTAVKLQSVVGTNAISVFGNKLASTGMSEEAATAMGLTVASSTFEDNDRPEFMNTFDRVKTKIVYEKESLRLVGAQIGSYGDQSHTEAIFYLALAIQKGMKIPEIAFSDVYFLPHFNKPFNFILGAMMQALGLTYIHNSKPKPVVQQ